MNVTRVLGGGHERVDVAQRRLRILAPLVDEAVLEDGKSPGPDRRADTGPRRALATAIASMFVEQMNRGADEVVVVKRHHHRHLAGRRQVGSIERVLEQVGDVHELRRTPVDGGGEGAAVVRARAVAEPERAIERPLIEQLVGVRASKTASLESTASRSETGQGAAVRL